MNGPRLSVVVPTCNRSDLLAACLRSLKRFAPDDVEIIVVDDGSPDAIASSVAAQFKISTIHFAQSGGFCRAANAGFVAATAPIVELLNDDAEVTENWSEPALAAFDDPGIVAVAPLVLRWPATDDPPTIDSAGDEYDRGGFARQRGRGELLSSHYITPKFVDGASGSAGFFRRDAVLAAGGFHESFRAYFEDVDLSCRLRRAGGRILYVPQSRVLHRGSSSHRRGSPQLVAQQSCNEERLYWRNRTGRLGEHARHAAVLLAKAARRAGEGTLVPWLSGRLRALGMLRHDNHCGGR